MSNTEKGNTNALTTQAKPPMAVESSGSALAAQAKANVEARFLVAMNNRRDWDDVRVELMKECRRPGFANNLSAYYKKPIGQGIEGLGIRFVEVAFRCMRNIMPEIAMIWEDDDKEIHRVSVTDLESNVTYSMDIKITKTVERKSAPAEIVISSRTNSYGKTVYTIPATDDDLLNKRGALISKAVRTLGIRLVPGDLQDEAIVIIKSVRLNKTATDPEAERKSIIDAFASLSVKPSDLKEYLGYDISKCSPATLVDLRALYGALKDGEATWVEVMDNKASQNDLPPTPEQDLKDQAGNEGDVIDIKEEHHCTCGGANGEGKCNCQNKDNQALTQESTVGEVLGAVLGEELVVEGKNGENSTHGKGGTGGGPASDYHADKTEPYEPVPVNDGLPKKTF